MKAASASNRILRIYFLTAAILIFLVALAFLAAAEFLIKPGGEKIAVQNNYAKTNVLIGAGDIANCADLRGAKATARLLEEQNGVIFTLGDNVYEGNSQDPFGECFEPSWGKYKSRIRPALGNHDYELNNAKEYFKYFGLNAGEKGKGYYSYKIATWHIIVLNSDCERVGGCAENSPQADWLKADLAANPALCTLAYWHHPLFDSNSHGKEENTKPFWSLLYEFGAEVILNGHAHNYERFAPQTPAGVRDEATGIREFVAGTGGGVFQPLSKLAPNSQASDSETFGVLKLELNSGEYNWQFIPVAGGKFTDSGSAKCH